MEDIDVHMRFGGMATYVVLHLLAGKVNRVQVLVN